MALLYDLGKFGLGKVEGKAIFSVDEHVERSPKETLASETQYLRTADESLQMEEESERIFAKSMECPLCEHKFKLVTPKANKQRRVGMDLDLRPTYQGIDIQKYNVLSCPKCGYSTLSYCWGKLMPMQVKRLNAQLVANFVPQEPKEARAYTYAEALDLYRLAMATSLIKDSKISDRAYIILRAAWLLRGWREHLPEDDPRVADMIKEENEYLNFAYEGFTEARMTEDFPMCGMDEVTVTYLIAALACYFGDYAISLKLIAGILTSYAATEHVKDKARELKEMIRARVKQGK